MNKKNIEDDSFSINDFAEFADISAGSLRHYDREGIFSPAQYADKYRRYSPLQITTVKMIRVLTEIGAPLKEVKELAATRTPEKMLRFFRKHKERIANEIKFLQAAYSIINIFSDLLYEAISITETEISISEMAERRIILGDENDFSETTGFQQEFIRFCKVPHEPKSNISYPVGGYFENMEVFQDEPSKPTRFFFLDPQGNEIKSAGLYLVGYTRGYYGQTNDLPKRMAAYAKKNGLVFNGPVYNIYLTDEISELDPGKYLLQVSASVRETKRIQPQHHF